MVAKLFLLLMLALANSLAYADRIEKSEIRGLTWLVTIEGVSGGVSEELYVLHEMALEGVSPGQIEIVQEGKSLKKIIRGEGFNSYYKTEDITDLSKGRFGIEFTLDPKTPGYQSILSWNNTTAFHIFGSAAESVSQLLSKVGWFWQGQLASKLVTCKRVRPLQQEQIVCRISLEDPDRGDVLME